MALKINGCKLNLELKCQSPMIHFQGEEKSATLRSSEVKPKLDRYLLECEPRLKKYVRKDTEALDYKMQIIGSVKKNDVSIGRQNPPYDLYYGKIEKAIEKDCTVEIICFYKDLMEAIKKYIEDFFIAYNFGTMQGKGFGSFVPVQYNRLQLTSEQIQHIGDVLKEHTGSKEFYYVAADKEKRFLFIKNFYKIMKSGYNQKNLYETSFLFQYMHEKGINNEKAWMKHYEISPDIYDISKKNWSEEWEDRRKRQPCNNAKYVRGLLGISNGISYKEDMNPRNRMNIKISNKKIERTESPVYFKVVSNYVFIVAKRIPKAVYGQEFNFYNKKTRIGKNLRVPEENEFDIDDFLRKYVIYYNKNENIKGIKKREKVYDITIKMEEDHK